MYIHIYVYIYIYMCRHTCNQARRLVGLVSAQERTRPIATMIIICGIIIIIIITIILIITTVTIIKGAGRREHDPPRLPGRPT